MTNTCHSHTTLLLSDTLSHYLFWKSTSDGVISFVTLPSFIIFTPCMLTFHCLSKTKNLHLFCSNADFITKRKKKNFSFSWMFVTFNIEKSFQVKDICNELDVRSLCHKILQNVSILLKADRGSLFLVQGKCNSRSADGSNR